MQVKCEFRYFLKFFKFFSKKHLHFLQTSCIISEYGSLVKRLRRRPLTAKTGVRFPYELLLSGACMAPFFVALIFFLPIINASKKARQFSAGLLFSLTNLLFCVNLNQLFQHCHRLFHSLNGNVLIRSMACISAGSDVRARQTHEA